MRMEFTPLYFRIQERLRAQIAAGEFANGARLPSESALAREFLTTRGTVRQALARLVFEGLIVREMGRGTFVSPPRVESSIDTSLAQSFEEQMAARGSKVTLRLLGFDPVPAPAEAAAALALAPGARVYRLRRLRLVDGTLIGFEQRYMLASLGERVPAGALKTLSAIALVATVLGAPLGRIAVSVEASLATAELARLLKVARASPVLVRAHTFFEASGRPVLHGESYYRGDKYRFSYVFGTGRAAPAAAPRP
ncbi:MAG: GntR family transcriptional regulator [Pseudomonadota bacterium]